MSLNLAAIFGSETGEVVAPADPPENGPSADVPDDPGGRLPGDFGTARQTAWPILEGAEHFSLWVDDVDAAWPEFMPGYHHDIRQPSRLQGLLAPNHTFEPIDSKTIAQNCA